MRQFEVKVSDSALEDADKVYDYICNQLCAPQTAARYYQGLINKMRSLERGADSIAVDLLLSSLFGITIRRINYKKLAILYSISDDIVIIERVIPQKMVV